MTTLTHKDGRMGAVFATLATTDDTGKPVRAWWVRLPDGTKELWYAAEVTDGPV